MSSARLPGRTSASRRREIWSTASATHCAGPGEQPDLLEDDERRDGHGPQGGARLGDRRAGTGTTGAPHSPASRASSPPEVTTTMLAPAAAASPAASTVSSVSPENDMANTSEPAADEVGRGVGLHHHDRHGQERARPRPP